MTNYYELESQLLRYALDSDWDAKDTITYLTGVTDAFDRIADAMKEEPEVLPIKAAETPKTFYEYMTGTPVEEAEVVEPVKAESKEKPQYKVGKMSNQEKQEIKEAYENGLKTSEIAEELNRSPALINKFLIALKTQEVAS